MSTETPNSSNGSRSPKGEVRRHKPASAPAHRSSDLTLREVLAMFRRNASIIRSRWRAGLLAALVVAILAVVYVQRSPVEYTARTVLFAQGTLDKVIEGQNAASNDALGLQLENTLRNHLSVMESRSFRTRIIKSLSPAERSLTASPYLTPGSKPDDDFLLRLLDEKITVDRERGREFFTIEVRHRSAETALMLASRFSREYLALVQNQFRDANKAGVAMLETQAAALRKEIAQAADQRLDFRKENQIMSMADSQGILAERLKRIDAARTDARIHRLQLETQLAQVEASMKRASLPWDNAYLASYGNNAQLRRDLDSQTNERTILSSRYGPSHPKIRDLDASIAGITADVKHNFSVAADDLQLQLESIRQVEHNLQAEFDSGFGKSIETEKLASRSDIFATDIEVKRQNLIQLEKKIGDAGIYSQLPVDFLQIADAAFIVEPRFSLRTVKFSLAAILTALVFLGAPLVFEMFDRRLISTSDPEAILGLRLLGAVPILRMKESQRAHMCRAGLNLAASDAFGDVAGELDLMSHHHFPKVIMVSSTLPGEGKSMVVSNLASTYTAQGRKVVILDLDLRRPNQHILHNVAQGGGFLEWVKAGFPHDNLLVAGSTLGLHVLADGVCLVPAGGVQRLPNEFFTGKQMEYLLGALRLNFDVILIDSPPAGLFQDALKLARLSDERILVARVERAPIAHIGRVISDFERVGAAFTGIVLNSVRPNQSHEAIAYVARSGRSAYYASAPSAAPTPTLGRPEHNGTGAPSARA